MKKNVYVIWVETRLGHIDDDEEDMETEVELYEIVDCLETAKKEILRLNTNNLDHWNVEFWYSEEPLIKDISEVGKEIYLTTPENYDYIMTLIDNNKKLGKEIERLNNILDTLMQDMALLNTTGVKEIKPKYVFDRIVMLRERVDKE